MIRRPNRLPSYLTQTEVRAFFATISNVRDRAMFALAYAFGLRVGEIELLDREYIDLGPRLIRPLPSPLPPRTRFLPSEQDRQGTCVLWRPTPPFFVPQFRPA